MNISVAFEPPEQVGAAPTRRELLALGGGLGLAAFLSGCGVSRVPVAPAAASAPAVRITTTGATFNPTVELADGSTATVSWAVVGGTTVTGLNPTISFGTAATRRVLMTVDDGGADAMGEVVTLNLGFNHSDDEGIYNMGARYDKKGQDVTLVEYTSRLTGLQRFAAANTALTGSLDFTGCSRLEYIECFKAQVQSVNLTGCTSLVRLVMEQVNLTALDLNPVAATLRDLRAAAQHGGSLTLTPLKAPMAALYHFCVVEQAVVNPPTAEQLPVVEERWDRNTSQSGSLTSASTAMRSLLTSGNRYTTADLTNQFPAGRMGKLEAGDNDLTAITLTGCSGLSQIDLSSNRLGTDEVDAILALVASWGTRSGLLNLSANSAPSASGVASQATLTGRGWEVSTDT